MLNKVWDIAVLEKMTFKLRVFGGQSKRDKFILV